MFNIFFGFLYNSLGFNIIFILVSLPLALRPPTEKGFSLLCACSVGVVGSERC
jgi:hypothetical protein